MTVWRKFYLLAFFAVVLGCMAVVPKASAQNQTTTNPTPQTDDQSAPDNTLHIAVTPYIWFAGVHGDVGALGHEASVHADFSDIFKYVNIGAMGTVELRYNRFVIPLDVVWIKLSDNRALPFDQGVDSVHAKLNETILTPKIGYRMVDKRRFKVDAVMGLRYWHLGNTLTLQPTQPLGSIYESANWVDGVGGMRFQVQLTPKVSMNILGDAGGGGSRLDYQVAGLLGLRVSKKITLEAGYRYLVVDYQPQGTFRFLYDVAMPGIVFGATINLK